MGQISAIVAPFIGLRFTAFLNFPEATFGTKCEAENHDALAIIKMNPISCSFVTYLFKTFCWLFENLFGFAFASACEGFNLIFY